MALRARVEYVGNAVLSDAEVEHSLQPRTHASPRLKRRPTGRLRGVRTRCRSPAEGGAGAGVGDAAEEPLPQETGSNDGPPRNIYWLENPWAVAAGCRRASLEARNRGQASRVDGCDGVSRDRRHESRDVRKTHTG